MIRAVKALLAFAVCFVALSSLHAPDPEHLQTIGLKFSLLKSLLAIPVMLIALAVLYPPEQEPSRAPSERRAHRRRPRPCSPMPRRPCNQPRGADLVQRRRCSPEIAARKSLDESVHTSTIST
jgi:hypothetical protein